MHFEKLVKLMETLRGPHGCPWDKEQTIRSLKPFLIEELYELIDAMDENYPDKIREELGDLLFQIVFISQLSKELGQFDINGVIGEIHEKMINRHPHVFAKGSLGDQSLLNQWEEHKKQEGKHRDSVLSGVPASFPALLRAQKLQERASKVGFDWKTIEDVFNKYEEEFDEFRKAVDGKDKNAIEEELGDIFFVLVRAASFLGVNPENALRRTINKFISRFRHIEMRASEKGMKLSKMTLEEMEVLWEEAKGL